MSSDQNFYSVKSDNKIDDTCLDNFSIYTYKNCDRCNKCSFCKYLPLDISTHFKNGKNTFCKKCYVIVLHIFVRQQQEDFNRKRSVFLKKPYLNLKSLLNANMKTNINISKDECCESLIFEEKNREIYKCNQYCQFIIYDNSGFHKKYCESCYRKEVLFFIKNKLVGFNVIELLTNEDDITSPDETDEEDIISSNITYVDNLLRKIKLFSPVNNEILKKRKNKNSSVKHISMEEKIKRRNNKKEHSNRRKNLSRSYSYDGCLDNCPKYKDSNSSLKIIIEKEHEKDIPKKRLNSDDEEKNDEGKYDDRGRYDEGKYEYMCRDEYMDRDENEDKNEKIDTEEDIKLIEIKNAYRTLNIPNTSSKAIIRDAYYKLSLLYHTDRPTGNKDKFQEINNAYSLLINI